MHFESLYICRPCYYLSGETFFNLRTDLFRSQVNHLFCLLSNFLCVLTLRVLVLLSRPVFDSQHGVCLNFVSPSLYSVCALVGHESAYLTSDVAVAVFVEKHQRNVLQM